MAPSRSDKCFARFSYSAGGGFVSPGKNITKEREKNEAARDYIKSGFSIAVSLL